MSALSREGKPYWQGETRPHYAIAEVVARMRMALEFGAQQRRVAVSIDIPDIEALVAWAAPVPATRPADGERAYAQAKRGAYFALIDGSEERGQIVCSALLDARMVGGVVNVVELTAWVEAYLDRWDELR